MLAAESEVVQQIRQVGKWGHSATRHKAIRGGGGGGSSDNIIHRGVMRNAAERTEKGK
jgi:hypothetical protein